MVFVVVVIVVVVVVLLRRCTCESRGGRPGLSVPNKPYGFLGRKAKHH